MKTLKLLASLLLFAGASLAQTAVPITTLSAAVTSKSTTFITVTSTTGMTAGTTYLYVDGELMFVNGVLNNGNLQVRRGASGTVATTHLSGALVFNGPATAFQAYDPTGSCTRGNLLYVPWINPKTGNFADCVGGVFVVGDNLNLQNTQFRVLAPNSGGTAYTSLNTNGTTLAATTMYCTEIDLPYNKYVTGIGIMNGTTATTDNHLVVLYDSAGNLLANSATAGVVASGASTYQGIAFTSKIYLVGPAQYFGCMQTNGTTATVRMIVTGTQDTYLTKGVTGQTFGTIPATITVPTTFTTAVGPYEYLY